MFNVHYGHQCLIYGADCERSQYPTFALIEPRSTRVNAPVQYGSGVKATAVYLTVNLFSGSQRLWYRIFSHA